MKADVRVQSLPYYPVIELAQDLVLSIAIEAVSPLPHSVNGKGKEKFKSMDGTRYPEYLPDLWGWSLASRLSLTDADVVFYREDDASEARRR